MKPLVYFVSVLALAAILALGVFAVGIMKSGERGYGALESIDGIPYPTVDGRVRVLEKLAHTDIYLEESVFAKELTLELTFDPGNVTELAVGVRENSFWLSYPKVLLWSEGDDAGLQTRTITIPITDAMQDSNQSIDVMFFATTDKSTSEVDEGVTDTTNWELVSFMPTVTPEIPTIAATKNFVRSVITRERPL